MIAGAKKEFAWNSFLLCEWCQPNVAKVKLYILDFITVMLLCKNLHILMSCSYNKNDQKFGMKKLGHNVLHITQYQFLYHFCCHFCYIEGLYILGLLLSHMDPKGDKKRLQ